MSKSVSASIQYSTCMTTDGIVRRDPECVAPPFIIHLLILGEVFGSDTWLVNRPENILEHSFPYQRPIVGYRYCRRWRIVRPLDVLSENVSRMRVI
jgi:hypothetical protein